jgi:hypothetical protein
MPSVGELLLRKQTLPGGRFEIRRGDMLLTGPIMAADNFGSYVSLSLGWAACSRILSSPPDWQVWDYQNTQGFDLGTCEIIPFEEGVFQLWAANRGGAAQAKLYLPGFSALLPHEVKGMPVPVGNKSSWNFPRVRLSRRQWEAFGDHRRQVLPRCCTNISELRETIMTIYKRDGYVWPASRQDLIELHSLVVKGHDHDWSALESFMRQAVPGVQLVQSGR